MPACNSRTVKVNYHRAVMGKDAREPTKASPSKASIGGTELRVRAGAPVGIRGGEAGILGREISMMDKKAIRRWRRDVWRIFEKEGFTPAELMAALVLAAVAFFGTDLDVLCELTGHSRDYCRKVLRRLRKQRVVSGQKLRTAWHDDKAGGLATILDAGVAAGMFSRSPDPKRSAAQKARAPETRHRGPTRPRAILPAGAMFTPEMQKSNPLYGLPEWETKK